MTEMQTPEQRSTDRTRFESLGRLTPGIAHEINTPMQYLGDNAHFLRSAWQDLDALLDASIRIRDRAGAGPISADDAAALVEAIRHADLDYLRVEVPKAIERSIEGVQRIGNTVRAMKEFAQGDEGSKTPFDLNHVIDNTLAVARNELKYVADVATDFDPQLPAVSGFAGEISVVILDLLLDAARAIASVPDDGRQRTRRLVVRTRCVADAVEISIGDTGPDIPDEVRSQIFSPSFSSKGGGREQGLAAAHHVIVDRHDGAMWLETETGQGTTVVIRLPLTNA
jgi:signal transduction histidine kinase